MRDSNRSIGGYFELETSSGGGIFHVNALALNSGRNAFEYVLRLKGFKRIYIPYFTCEVLLQPVRKLNLDHTFYRINETFLPELSSLGPKEAILYTNYFGVNTRNAEQVSKKFDNVVIDNAQAFFDRPVTNANTIYSPRKFFGLPDGGLVYTQGKRKIPEADIDLSMDRMAHLLVRIEKGSEAGYPLFKANELKLNDQPIKRMSRLTARLMGGIDYPAVMEQRLRNFKFLHKHLRNFNRLTPILKESNFVCPMVYPFWAENGGLLRSRLQKNRIYVAQYWPEVMNTVRKSDLEFELTKNIVHLPIDQRYAQDDLTRVLNVLLNG